MGQISKGVRVGYMAKGTSPKAYTFLPELTGVPALGAAPSTHQRTTLNDSAHRYIKGLVDVGGALEFPCIFTGDIITDVNNAITAQGLGALEWCVEFPVPLGRRAYFIGEIGTVYNESVEVDAPITGTVAIVPSGVIGWEEAKYAVKFNSNGGSAVASQTVSYGGMITEPTKPTKSGSTFGGWYHDVAYTKAMDFARDVVDGPMTLYAKWNS